MFQPPYFKQKDNNGMLEFIRNDPLATIVTQSENGLTVNHIPLLLKTRQNSNVLQGHIAKANNMWKDYQAEKESVAIFTGPQSYISPNWYPSKKRDHKAVPTWNYTAVHARGLIKFIHDKDWLLEHLTNLSDFNEQNMQKPWHLSEAPEDYIKSMLPAIVGFEMEITNMSGQSKMSQNHNVENRQGVISGLQSQNKENVATWVKNPDMS